MKSQRIFWMIALILSFVLAACATDSGNTANPTAVDTDIALSQSATFNGELIGGAFTVSFPDGWSHLVGQADITLSNQTEIIGNLDGEATLPAGGLAMNISVTPTESIGELSLTSFLEQYLVVLESTGADVSFGDIETLQRNNDESAQISGTMQGSDALILAVDLSGSYVAAIIITPEGELQQHMETIDAIIGSVQLSPAE